MSNIKQETLSGVKWQFITKLTMQPISFIFGIILARLISPAEMGVLGLTSIFFAVANQLKDCGFGAALIRKQDRTELDCNTVFWFNIVISAVMCMALFLAAPWFATFFDVAALTDLTRVSALMLFLNSSTTVHWTLYSAQRDFKTPAIISLFTTLLPMPFTIWAAYAGWSYWAMMVQGVGSGLLSLIVIWIVSPWKPRLLFSRASFMEFFSFGSKLLATGLINTTYNESRNLIIGKFYNPSQLAFYHRGFKLAELPISIIYGIVGSVSFPILASIAHDQQKLYAVYRQYYRLTLLVVFWLMLTVVANCESIIFTLYGSSWSTAALYAQILILGIIFNPVTYLINNLVTVKGHTDIMLRSQIIIRSFGMTVLILGASHSMIGICISAALSGAFSAVFWVMTISRLGWVHWREHISDAWQYVSLALFVNIPALFLNLYYGPSYILLIVGLCCSGFLFIIFMQSRYDPTWAMLINLLEEKKVLRFIPFLKRKRAHCE